MILQCSNSMLFQNVKIFHLLPLTPLRREIYQATLMDVAYSLMFCTVFLLQPLSVYSANRTLV